MFCMFGHLLKNGQDDRTRGRSITYTAVQLGSQCDVGVDVLGDIYTRFIIQSNWESEWYIISNFHRVNEAQVYHPIAR